jgi:glycosyltransferase involved in cell wall biosynthesis
LTQYYPPEIGAPQIRLRSMVRELGRNGIGTQVVTALPNYPAGKLFPGYRRRLRVNEEIDGVPVLRTWVYAATGKSARVRLANYLSFTLTALFAVFFRRAPDVLFVESQPLSLGIVGLAMKWIRGVPYIYNVPDLQVDVARQLGFLSNRRLLQIATWMEDLFLRQAASVSTVTEGFIDHFVERGVPRERVTFLPNGADTEFLRPLPPSKRLLERWGLQGKKVFVYVGTHAFYHGLETLLGAAERLAARRDIAVLLVGDGPERERLKRLAGERGLENVVFGDSPYEEMAELYSIACASVATLRDMKVAEGMRLSKIFPSLSCAVPVIYSGRGEAAALLEARDCGVVVAPEDPAALAAAMAAMADDADRRGRQAASGRAFVVDQYSWASIVRNWLAEIRGRDLVGARASGREPGPSSSTAVSSTSRGSRE